MTAYRPVLDAVIGCKLKQNANEGCNSCASLAGLVLSFIACFILLVIAPLTDDRSRSLKPFVSTWAYLGEAGGLAPGLPLKVKKNCTNI